MPKPDRVTRLINLLGAYERLEVEKHLDADAKMLFFLGQHRDNAIKDLTINDMARIREASWSAYRNASDSVETTKQNVEYGMV